MTVEIELQNNTEIEKMVNELKSLVEWFELKLYLGKTEAIDELEKQIKGFNEFINEIKNKINTSDFINTDKAEEIKNKIEKLQIHLTESKAETINKLEEEVGDIEVVIRAIELLLESENKATKDKFSGFSENFNIKSSKLKTIIDIVKLQYTLGKAELRDYLQSNKKEIEKRISSFKQKVEGHHETNGKFWNEFQKESLAIFNYLKDEIKHLK